MPKCYKAFGSKTIIMDKFRLSLYGEIIKQSNHCEANT